jgi:hypothetical protein
MPEGSPEVEEVVRDRRDAKRTADGAASSAACRTTATLSRSARTRQSGGLGAGASTEAHVVRSAFTAVLEHVEAQSHGELARAAVCARIESGEDSGLPVR